MDEEKKKRQAKQVILCFGIFAILYTVIFKENG